MPLQQTSGNATADAYGGGVALKPNYIEDVFSTYLTTGNSSTQTVNNGIDLAGKGGMIWFKQRNAANNNALFDTVRGTNKLLYSNTTAAQIDSVASYSDYTVTSFNSNGVTLGNDPNLQVVNTSPNTYASWTFRKQPKFFDVVTWTGDGTGNRNIPHSLGSVPGCIMLKKTSAAQDWYVYHRALTYPNAQPETNTLKLNTTDAGLNSTAWQSGPTSTYFPVLGSAFNVSGDTYVAYLFAHNAGGFGLTGTDNVISCGSYTGTSTVGNEINVGFEPQFIIIKRATGTAEHWQMFDNMRGIATGGNDAVLYPSLSNAEYAAANAIGLTATGFKIEGSGLNVSGDTYIYIAIRRGPMKVPTDATKVFAPVTYTGTAATLNITGASFPPDLSINDSRVTGSGWGAAWFDRLRGPNSFIRSTATNAENSSYTNELTTFNMNGVTLGASTNGVTNNSGEGYVDWLFRRAPSFFDEVCYTGTGSARTLNHNLGVAPEMMIVKVRGANSGSWRVYHSALGPTKGITIDLTNAAFTLSTIWNDTAPTSSVFTVGTYGNVNLSGDNFVAYLFATCAGVSKVGSYTGTGATQTISCGFTGGARFVLVKRTDSTGDWYVWDTARGMVSGTDPSLLLNSTAAEVNANSIYTATGGFQIVSTAAGINASGGNYIFLAIA